MLSDISNLQNLAKQINPDAKNKGTTITTKDYVDKLEKVLLLHIYMLGWCFPMLWD